MINQLFVECRTCKKVKQFDTPRAQHAWAMTHVEREHAVFAYTKEVAA